MAFPSFPPFLLKPSSGAVLCTLACEGHGSPKEDKTLPSRCVTATVVDTTMPYRELLQPYGVTKSVWVSQASEMSNSLPGEKIIKGKAILEKQEQPVQRH